MRLVARERPSRLSDALSRAAAASRRAAARLVVVGAVDDHATSFYRHYGFTPVPDEPGD